MLVETWLLIVGIIFCLALICANVFYILDLSSNNNSNKNKTTKSNESLNDNNIENNQLLLQLEKLVKLKESNLLTQEEFDKIKTEIITKNISNN